MVKDGEVSIIIPTLNEELVIGDTLKKLVKLKIDRPFEIIIIDDNSRDKTVEVVKKFSKENKNIRFLIRKKNRGFGYSVVDGSKEATGRYIILTMADGSDDISIIPKMLKKLDEGCDLVIASRNIKGGKRINQGFMKSLSSKSFSKLVDLLFKLGVKDSTNAFRAFRKDILKKIVLTSGDFTISPEMVIKSKIAGLMISEVPAKFVELNVRKSKFPIIKMGKSYLGLIMREWKRK